MTKKGFDPILPAVDDGLVIPVVREWSVRKYRLFGYYCDIFTSSMHHHWNNLLYIDLFAGAGYSRIKETGEILKSSAMIALSVPHRFTKYIFCEEDVEKLTSLEARVKREFPEANVQYVAGNCNESVETIVSAIPPYRQGNTLLPFCFADPYDLNLWFQTIKNLGQKRLMDFLILQALHMDANRNFGNYIVEENKKIERYLGLATWRQEFQERNLRQQDFVAFLAKKYRDQMIGLGYLEPSFHQIRSNDKNLPLYYLAFFTKHVRGKDFFKKVERLSTSQTSLDL
jgi:three-Cys-motif partner protein